MIDAGKGEGLGAAGGRGDHPEVAATPADVGTAPRRPGAFNAVALPGHGTGGLADRLGQRDQVVAARGRRLVFTLVPHELPASRRCEPASMPFAQVIGVWLGVGGEGSDHRSRIGVDVGQRGHGSLGATVAGAAPW
jgi:hypothetical protein